MYGCEIVEILPKYPLSIFEYKVMFKGSVWSFGRFFLINYFTKNYDFCEINYQKLIVFVKFSDKKP
jgi:hypothetical protein